MYKLFVLLFLNIFFISFAFAKAKTAIENYGIIKQHNLFAPLWKAKSFDVSQNFKPSQNDNFRELKRQQEEQEKQEKLRKLREDEGLAKSQKEEEQRDLENKKLQMEQAYKLNGIIHESGSLQAIVIDNKNATYFVKSGEEFNDFKVVNIDDKKGSIKFSYQDRIEVILYME